jgi:hypothetical protein
MIHVQHVQPGFITLFVSDAKGTVAKKPKDMEFVGSDWARLWRKVVFGRHVGVQDKARLEGPLHGIGQELVIDFTVFAVLFCALLPCIRFH